MKYLLNMIVERSLGILKVYWHQNYFCLKVNALWWGNSSYMYKKGQPAPPGLAWLVGHVVGPTPVPCCYKSHTYSMVKSYLLNSEVI